MMMAIRSVCVLGLGYIGLPTASILATQGLTVHGIDVSPRVVDTINQGLIHIEEPGLKTLVQAAVHSSNLKAYEQVQPADAFIIAVPTPITDDKRADLSYVESAMRAILPHLQPGNLVILESTSPPGTTRDILAPMLKAEGWKLDEDIFLAHCPERVLPGKILKELTQNSRVIGGIGPRSAEIARQLYLSFVEGDIHLTDATTAEMVKIMENTYRDVNIALANELAQLCTLYHISAWDVIRYANLHPRVNIHQPGPGVGGHCISVDPWFLVEKHPEAARIIGMARQINDSMPHYTYKLIQSLVQDIQQPKIALLGVTYKPDVDDVRESPALELIEQMEANPDFRLTIYDPHVKLFSHELSGLEAALSNADLIVVAVAHTEFKYLNPAQVAKTVRHKRILDTKQALSKEDWVRHGFDYALLGSGEPESVLTPA
jgi:UDP-N-acetyl-D-mannosaminuronic acid dehydrogenase